LRSGRRFVYFSVVLCDKSQLGRTVDHLSTFSPSPHWVSTGHSRTILKQFSNFTFWSVHTTRGRWDSAIGIATGYGLEDRGVRVRVPIWSRIFSSPRRPDRFRGPHSLLSSGYRGSFPGLKRQGREADHSPPTSAEIKKMWIYTSTFPYAFIA
jgi:hypothetical protein